MRCICGTETREAFAGIASAGKSYPYCPNCKEDAMYIAANPDKAVPVVREKPVWKKPNFEQEFVGDFSVGIDYGSVPQTPQPNFSQQLKALHASFGTEHCILLDHGSKLGPVGTIVDMRAFTPLPRTDSDVFKCRAAPCDGRPYDPRAWPSLAQVMGSKYGIDKQTGMPVLPDLRANKKGLNMGTTVGRFSSSQPNQAQPPQSVPRTPGASPALAAPYGKAPTGNPGDDYDF